MKKLLISLFMALMVPVVLTPLVINQAHADQPPPPNAFHPYHPGQLQVPPPASGHYPGPNGVHIDPRHRPYPPNAYPPNYYGDPYYYPYPDPYYYNQPYRSPDGSTIYLPE